jgi:NitT/TauT family transport system substrate-binding protein
MTCRRPWRPTRATSSDFVRIVVLIAVALVVAGCGSDGGDNAGAPSADSQTTEGASPFNPVPLPEETSVTVAIPAPVEPMSALLLADHFGEFEKENLDVEIVSVPSTDSLPQLASGELDFAMTSFQVSLLNAIDQGFEIKMIAPLMSGIGGNQEGLYIRNELVDGAPENLEGKTFGFSITPFAGGAPVLAIGDYLDEGGVGIDEVEGAQVSNDARLASLESGDVDGIWMIAPVPPEIDDTATRVATYGEAGSLAGVLAGPAMLDGDAAVPQAFLRALARTTDTYLQGEYFSDPEVVRAMSEITGAPETAFVAGQEYVWSPTLDLPPGDAVDRMQEYLLQRGDLLTFDEPMPYEQLVDASFVDSLGLQ